MLWTETVDHITFENERATMSVIITKFDCRLHGIGTLVKMNNGKDIYAILQHNGLFFYVNFERLSETFFVLIFFVQNKP